MANEFTVVAGKFEQWDGETIENIKYIESFNNLDGAIRAYKDVMDYPFARIEYKDVELTVHPIA